jgi:hypothetical protein
MFVSPNCKGAKSVDPESAEDLAIIGELAGFRTTHMVGLLSTGLRIATLVDLITWRLEILQARVVATSSRPKA